MKNFDPNFFAPDMECSSAPSFGIYSYSNNIVTFSLRVDIEKVEEWGCGPYSIDLPKPPVTDYVFRNGGFYLNGGIQIPLTLLARQGETKAFLGYMAPNGEDIPITSTIPVVLRAQDTFFYSSGTYFSLDTEEQ